ncbi:MAG: molybdenum cofactor guanylyltransferase [Clostridiales bacterium]|nr:molybdenum cofactor guanylyltransferase [Clostridiales bacterium]
MKQFGTAVILAGGKSTRMGFDKQLLTLHKQKIYTHIGEMLKKEFDDILVVTNRPELYADTGYRVCSDAFAGMGPLAGIHAALLNSHSQYAYLFACDMPVICLPYIRHLKGIIQNTGAQICVTRRGGRIEPFNGFYHVGLAEDASVRLSSGSSSVFRFISAADTHVVEEGEAVRFDKTLRMFTNINTKSEYESYLSGLLSQEG